jgi:polysaccharide pyruvyl transferase WcaK-like protein
MLPIKWTSDKILDADLIIQSGAPVYWCHNIPNTHCYNNEWYKPLIKKRWLKYKKNIPLLNLAAGTCQRYYSDGTEFCDKCNNYIKEFYEYSTITTVRDTLAKKVLNNIGLDVKVIPCSSIFAIDEYDLKDEGEEYVVVNYMKGGGHYTFGQNIDFEKYKKEFTKFYFELKEKENVIISCHNQKEVNEALEFDPNAKIFYKKDDYLAYMKFYSKAKFGIMNRVHGAFMMASFGKPSIIIGNDSRARMAEEIGLKSYFVNEIDYDLLKKEYEFLKNGADNFKDRFKEIKEKAFNDYMEKLCKIKKTI